MERLPQLPMLEERSLGLAPIEEFFVTVIRLRGEA
jgi:hypothetical protein